MRAIPTVPIVPHAAIPTRPVLTVNGHEADLNGNISTVPEETRTLIGALPDFDPSVPHTIDEQQAQIVKLTRIVKGIGQ